MCHWNGIVEKKLICGFGYTLIRKFCNFTQNPKPKTQNPKPKTQNLKPKKCQQ